MINFAKTARPTFSTVDDDILNVDPPAQADDWTLAPIWSLPTSAALANPIWSSSLAPVEPASRPGTADQATTLSSSDGQPSVTTHSGGGLMINENINTSGAPAGFVAAVQAACQFFANSFSNNVTLNISFSWGALGTNVLASTVSTKNTYSYSSVVNKLKTEDSGIADDQGLVLPANDPFLTSNPAVAQFNGSALPANTLVLTNSEATILGLTNVDNPNNGGAGSDASITLGSGVNWNFSAAGGAIAGETDAVPVLEHEISEVMGRQLGSSSVDDDLLLPSTLALFRYASSGVVDTTGGVKGGYFSIDGGVTDLQSGMGEPVQIIKGVASDSDLADWNEVTDDAFGYGSPGTLEVTPVDTRVMEALGWKQAIDNWRPSGAGSWSNASNWSGGVPVITSQLAVNQGYAKASAPIIAESLSILGQVDLNAAGDCQILNGVSIVGGQLYLDFAAGGGGTSLTIGGPIINTGGVIDIGGGALTSVDKITVGNIFNLGGTIYLIGGASVPAWLEVQGAASLQGGIDGIFGTLSLIDDAVVEFDGGGQFTTIEAGGALLLDGSHAFVADSGALTSNSALVGLTTIDATGAFQLSDGASFTFSGLKNSGDITLTGNSATATILTLAGASTLNKGAITIGQDTKALVKDDALTGDGSVDIALGGILELEAKAGTTVHDADNTIEGAGELLIGSHGTVVLGANKFTGNTIVSSGAALSINSPTDIGAGELTLDGGSTLDLTGAATYANRIAINAGAATVKVTAKPVVLSGGIANGPKGRGALNVTGGGVLELTAASSYSDGTFVTDTTLEIAASADIALGALSLSDSATLDLTSSAVFNDTISISGVDTIETANLQDVLAGVIGNGAGGAGEMIATGGGTLELEGDNTYTGPTYISGATLEILDGDNLGPGVVAIVDDATLELNGSFALAQAFDISGLATFDVTAGDDVQLFGDISDLGSPGTLVLSGGGVLVLSHDNSYSGGTIVKAGTLEVHSDVALGSSAAIFDGGTTLELGENVALGNAIALVDDVAITVSSGNSATLSGAISQIFVNGSLFVKGAGSLTLTGDNTYAGGTTVSGGATLAIAADDNLGSGSLTLENGAQLDLDGLQFDLATAISIRGDVIFNTPTGDVAGVEGISQGQAGSALAVSGGGKLTISGDSTYSGGTTIESGTLDLAGAGAGGSGPVTFAPNSAGDIVEFNNALGQFGNVIGSGGTIDLNLADVNVTGGGDTIVSSRRTSVNLFGTNGEWDLFHGSHDTVSVNASQVSVIGRSDAVAATAGSLVRLANTGTDDDIVAGSNDTLALNNAEATLNGSSDTIRFSGSDALTANGTSEAFVFGADLGVSSITGFEPSERLRLSVADWSNFAALNASHDLFQSGGNTVIEISASDMLTLVDTQVSQLSATNVKFV